MESGFFMRCRTCKPSERLDKPDACDSFMSDLVIVDNIYQSLQTCGQGTALTARDAKDSESLRLEGARSSWYHTVVRRKPEQLLQHPFLLSLPQIRRHLHYLFEGSKQIPSAVSGGSPLMCL